MAGDYTVTEGNIAGYHAKGNVTSVPIGITRADMWSAFDKGQTATYEASFPNVKETVAVLPLSGASEGRTWLVVAGVAALVLLLAGFDRARTAVTELPDGNRNSLIAIRQSQFFNHN